MSAKPKAKAELVRRIGQLAAETGSSPEDLAVALEEYRSELEPLQDLIDAGIRDGGAADGETFLRELLEETKVRAGQRAR